MGEKIAIIGWGMIGNEFIENYNELGYNIHIITRNDKKFLSNNNSNITKHFVDITNENKIKEIIENISPDFVINTAAMTNVDLCEIERERAYKTNALAAGYIGKTCKKLGIPLCHISTDYVFDGERGNYAEDDKVNPINYYGWTKAEGEKILKELNHDLTSIVRISVPYGLSPIKVNFFMWVLNTLKEKKKLNVVIDQWNTPTYMPELVEGILKIYKKNIYGTLHFGGGEKVSRYEFALKVAEIFSYDKTLIEPVKSSELGWKANRPKDTSLICKNAERLLNINLKKIDECLNELKNSINGVFNIHP